MVLFRDDELRMIAAERAAEPRWKKRLRLFIKVLLCFGAMLGVSLFVLSTQGGNGAPLKKGIEEYLGQITGYQADIGHLNAMSFYPIVGLDFDDLSFYNMTQKEIIDDKGKKKNIMVRDQAVAEVGHVTAAMSFWDLFLARHTALVLKVADIDIAPGIADERAVLIKSMVIDPKGWQNKPAILVKGRYGAEDISATLEMVLHGRTFSMPDNAQFKVKIGEFEINGTAGHRFGKGLVLKIEKAGMPDKLVDGTLALSVEGKGVSLDANLHAGDSILKADLHRKAGTKLTGTIDMPVLTAGDIRTLIVLVTAVAERWPGAPGLDAELSLADVPDGMTALGRGKARMVLENGVLKLSNLSGHMVETLPSKDSRTLHIAADGLTLTVPRDPLVTCVGAKIKTDAKGMKIGPAVAGGGSSSYNGQGSVTVANHSTVNIVFTPSTKESKDCVLP